LRPLRRRFFVKALRVEITVVRSLSVSYFVALVALVVLGPPTAADAAPCSGRYEVDSINNTVTDKDTGLLWQRAADDVPRTWPEAETYCESLTLGGHTDWRLPAVFELQTIVDESVNAPAIDGTVFGGGGSSQNRIYWSATENALAAGFVWTVDFGVDFAGGTTRLFPVAGSTQRARCVR
jgi:hypothetical protein